MKKNHLIKLLVLKTLKARLIHNNYRIYDYHVSEEYKQQVLQETASEIQAYKELGELIGGDEFKTLYRRYRGEMNAHKENYKMIFLQEMIEYFETLIKESEQKKVDNMVKVV